MNGYFLVLDIGGTKIRYSLADQTGKLLGQRHILDTPNFLREHDLKGTELQNRLVASVRKIIENYKNLRTNILGLGISFAGPVDKHGNILAAPTIWGSNGIYPFSLRRIFEKELHIPSVLYNDITAAAECFGQRLSNKSYKYICIITVSSGIGLKVYDLRNRKVILDERGWGGEFGHAVFDTSPKAPICDCGGKGHLGALASGRSAERLAKEMAIKDPTMLSSSNIFSLLTEDQISAELIAEAAKKGDIFALKIVDIITYPLAHAISQLILAIGIEKFIIIGGFARALGFPYINCLRRHLQEMGCFGLSRNDLKNIVTLSKKPKFPELEGIGMLTARYLPEQNFTESSSPITKQYFKMNATKTNNYGILLVDKLLDLSNNTLATYCGTKKIVVCVDNTIFSLYGIKIKSYLESNNIDYCLIKLSISERIKNMDKVQYICQFAKENGIERKSSFLAIGGGIVMDIAGLAAHLYRRGVGIIRIPTTLVGVIDAGLGVKSGVNLIHSKNIIGAFSPPVEVLLDWAFLSSLPIREIRCGLAEMVKLAVVRDRELFEVIESSYQDILNRDFQNIKVIKLLENTVKRMLQELSQDLYEKCLVRSLDFGHTFSPAIELSSDFSVEHGEAVAIDMAISTQLSYIKGLCSEETRDRIIGLLMHMGIAIYHPICTVDLLWNQLDDIRKHRDGNLNIIIPSDLGDSQVIIDDISSFQIEKSLAYIHKLSQQVNAL